MKKKIVALLLTAAMAVSLMACGGTKETGSSENMDNSQAQNETQSSDAEEAAADDSQQTQSCLLRSLSFAMC